MQALWINQLEQELAEFNTRAEQWNRKQIYLWKYVTLRYFIHSYVHVHSRWYYAFFVCFDCWRLPFVLSLSMQVTLSSPVTAEGRCSPHPYPVGHSPLPVPDSVHVCTPADIPSDMVATATTLVHRVFPSWRRCAWEDTRFVRTQCHYWTQSQNLLMCFLIPHLRHH